MGSFYQSLLYLSLPPSVCVAHFPRLTLDKAANLTAVAKGGACSALSEWLIPQTYRVTGWGRGSERPYKSCSWGQGKGEEGCMNPVTPNTVDPSLPGAWFVSTDVIIIASNHQNKPTWLANETCHVLSTRMLRWIKIIPWPKQSFCTLNWHSCAIHNTIPCDSHIWDTCHHWWRHDLLFCQIIKITFLTSISLWKTAVTKNNNTQNKSSPLLTRQISLFFQKWVTKLLIEHRGCFQQWGLFSQCLSHWFCVSVSESSAPICTICKDEQRKVSFCISSVSTSQLLLESPHQLTEPCPPGKCTFGSAWNGEAMHSTTVYYWNTLHSTAQHDLL